MISFTNKTISSGDLLQIHKMIKEANYSSRNRSSIDSSSNDSEDFFNSVAKIIINLKGIN